MIRNFFIIMALALSLLPLSAATGLSEDIKNYGQCDVCPGDIHYGPDEAREIMGPRGQELVGKIDISASHTVKLDLDGVMKNGTKDDSDMGYEIQISFHQNIIYIRSLLDESYIQIVTDALNARRSGILSDWYPEIYLQATHADRIELKEPAETAWKKMKASHIYQWLASEKAGARPATLLKDKIIYALQLITEKKPS